jgi:hypothetical protein
MSLRYRYRMDSVGHSVLPLSGRWVRPRPIIGVTMIGPTDSRARDAVLDTAADDTVFPEELAVKIGLNLSNAPAGGGAGIGMGSVPLRYAEVTLRITDGSEQREWTAWIGFTPVRLVYPSLGFAGFLQFFTTIFLGDREEVELTVNSLYRGT